MNKQLELCDLELSKLLKEIGFDWYVKDHWSTHNDAGKLNTFLRIADEMFEDDFNYKTYSPYISNKNEVLYSAPILELAAKWFRDVHNIHIIVWYNSLCESWRIDSIRDIKADIEYETVDGLFKFYNQALSEGLKKACKIIKNK